MSEEVKVEKINIKIGDVEIALTVEAAKELKKVLNDLFGDKEYIYISTPLQVVPSYPVPYYPHNPYRYWEPYVTCYGNVTRAASPTGTCITINSIYTT